MAEPTDAEKAAAAAAEKAAAEKAAAAKAPWLEENYTGALTCDQAAARIEHLQLHGRTHIGDLKAYETKPAEPAVAVKGSK